MFAHEDGVVQSHFIRFGFVQEYTVRRFHREANASGDALDHGGEPSSSSAFDGHGIAGDNADIIAIDDLVQYMADGSRGDDDGEPAAVMEPSDAELFEEIINCIDDEDVLFRRPRWLDNFREMKQVAIDQLYKDCQK